MTWRLAKVMGGRWLTTNEVAAALGVALLDRPNVRGQLESAVKSGLADKRSRLVGTRQMNQYRWRM